MSKLKERLESLYRLAKLTDDEIKLLDANKLDDGRLNEVRTASFLLLHTARTKGVRIKFIFDDVKASPTSSPSMSSRPYPDSEFFRDIEEVFHATELRKKAHDEHIRRAEQRAREVKENRERAERETAARRASSSGPPIPRQKIDINAAKVRERVAREAEDALFGDDFQRPQSQPSKKGWARDSATPLIQSQYDGVCLACGKAYKSREQVWWVRNVGCSHFACGSDVLKNMASGT